MEKQTFVATKALITNNQNQVLIIRESKDPERFQQGKYGLPGGRLDFNEHPYDGLKREVKEETGLEINIGNLLDFHTWSPIVQDKHMHIVALFFHCLPLSEEVKLSHEHDHFAWLSKEEFTKYPLMPQEKEILSKFWKL